MTEAIAKERWFLYIPDHITRGSPGSDRAGKAESPLDFLPLHGIVRRCDDAWYKYCSDINHDISHRSIHLSLILSLIGGDDRNRFHRERRMVPEKKEGFLSTDDREIGGRVLSSLKRSAVTEFPPDLRIAVSAGVVRLEGSVSLLAEKAMIEDAVRFTEGVLAVENALRIVPCSARRSS